MKKIINRSKGSTKTKQVLPLYTFFQHTLTKTEHNQAPAKRVQLLFIKQHGMRVKTNI